MFIKGEKIYYGIIKVESIKKNKEYLFENYITAYISQIGKYSLVGNYGQSMSISQGTRIVNYLYQNRDSTFIQVFF